MSTTISRFQLQSLNPTVAKERELALEAERKAKTLDFFVNHYKHHILYAAESGKTSYTVSERYYHPFKTMTRPANPPELEEDYANYYFCKQIRDKVFTHKFTDENATELTEAFRKFYPDCTVTRTRISEEHNLIGRPDETYFVTLNEITIDWS